MLYTDHKPLTTAVRRSTEPWTAKQCRQLAYIAEFTSNIQHIAGSDNVVADTLSRPPGGGAASSGSESPPRNPVRADRGDKDKIKLSTSSGGLRYPVEALPQVNAVQRSTTPPSPPTRRRARHTAGGFFHVTSDREASSRRCGAPLRRLQRGGEIAGTAG